MKTRGRQDLFARKKAENKDGFDFFFSFAHSSSILDILFFVKFSGSGRGKSVSSIGVFLRSFLVKVDYGILNGYISNSEKILPLISLTGKFEFGQDVEMTIVYFIEKIRIQE